MRNDVINKGIRNVKYTFLAQMVVMGTGVLKTLLIPSFLSVKSYGYWQIYLFYLSYIGFFYLGFNDGVLLRYGKYDYDKLPFPIMRSSMRCYITMLAVFSVIFSFYTNAIPDMEKRFVMNVIAGSILMYGINGVLVYIFLITNQIKLYSFFTSLDQFAILVTAVLMIMAGNSNYRILLAMSFGSKFLMVSVMIFLCRKLFWGTADNLAVGFREFTENIKCGLALMLAQIMSMLLTGLGRIFVEYFGNIEEYAYYAFGMSVINIVMVCVTAVATVMYPTLSRIDRKDLPNYFNFFCRCVTVFNAVSVISYFPAAILIRSFFPQYVPILKYLYLFFALLTWQAKVNIVTSPYFRVLRKEREMLGINALGVIFFTIIGLPAILITHRIEMVAVCTFLTIFFIEILSENYLRRQLDIKMGIEIGKDIIINTVFIICSSALDLLAGLPAYVFFILVYLIIDRKTVVDVLKKIR